MLHIQTGNRLDVVQDVKDGRFKVTGLSYWGGEKTLFIPLQDPKALLLVLQKALLEQDFGENK